MLDSPPTLFMGRGHGDAARRVICFPHAGGSAGAFLAWQPAFGQQVDLQALEPPGHGRRIGELPIADLERLLDAIEGAVQPLLDRPCVLFGHSLGALIAFELARRLRHPAIERLVVSACRAPRHLPSPLVRELANLDDEAFVEGTRVFGGLPDEVLENEDLLAIFLPILRADFDLVSRYRYRPAALLDIPVVAINGEDDPHVPDEMLEAWQDETSLPLVRQTFAGGHFYLFEISVPALAEVLGLKSDPTLAG
jgi:surfactin synthase thioesterase subunit